MSTPNKTAGGLPTASQGRSIDLLMAARSNGHAAWVEGLTRLQATVIPDGDKRRIEIESEGDHVPSDGECLALLWAYER